MLRFLVQFGGERWHPGHVSLFDPALLPVVGACVGALIVWLLGLRVPPHSPYLAGLAQRATAAAGGGQR